MKKRGRKSGENIILFPDLERRLLLKGIDSLKDKNYGKAIELLEEAMQLEDENEEIIVALVLAYYESGYYEKAKYLCKDMMNKGIGDYFQTVDLYIMILIQLNEYAEMSTIIEALLEEKIPAEKRDHLIHMLNFCQKMFSDKEVIDNTQKEEEKVEHQIDIDRLHQHSDPEKQWILITELARINIRPYIQEIQTFLLSKAGNPFYKTLLLNILKEKEIEKEIEIEKFGDTLKVIPARLYDLKSDPFYESVITLLDHHLEHEDPILLENTKKLIDRQQIMIYPFDSWKPSNPNAWAAAYETISLEYLGVEDRIYDCIEKYDVEEVEVRLALNKIREIEEISYPII